jgi:hypothetical protein
MKKLLLLVVPLLLCGCAAKAVRMDMAGTDQSAAVPVKDLRPDSEKESEIFSLMITSSGYGTYRKGDEALDPPMPQVFRRMVYEKVGAGGAPTDITIHHMVVYMNMKSELRKGAIGSIGGVVGAVITASMASNVGVNMNQALVDRATFEAAGHEEYERAFYTEAENPERASVFVVYIDATVNGKRVFIRTMAPVRGPKGQAPIVEAVKSSIQFYLTQL